MLYEVFFDADVIISGSFSKTGASYQLLLLSELNLIRGVTCERVVQECERNIQKKLPDAIDVFHKIISSTLTIVENPVEDEMKKFRGYAHPKDLSVLGAALQNQI